MGKKETVTEELEAEMSDISGVASDVDEEDETGTASTVKKYERHVLDHSIVSFMVNVLHENQSISAVEMARKMNEAFTGAGFTVKSVQVNSSRLKALGLQIYQAIHRYERTLKKHNGDTDNELVLEHKEYADSGVIAAFRYFRKIAWTEKDKNSLYDMGKEKYAKLKARIGVDAAAPKRAKLTLTTQQKLDGIAAQLTRIERCLCID